VMLTQLHDVEQLESESHREVSCAWCIVLDIIDKHYSRRCAFVALHYANPYMHLHSVIVMYQKDADADAGFQNETEIWVWYLCTCLILHIDLRIRMLCLYISGHRHHRGDLYLAKFRSRSNRPRFPNNTLRAHQYLYLIPETRIAYLSFTIRPEIHAQSNHIVDRWVGTLVQ
jgi:hypothetical protein